MRHVTHRSKIEKAELFASKKVKKTIKKEYGDSLAFSEKRDFKIFEVNEYNKTGDLVRRYEEKKGSLYLAAKYEYNSQHRQISLYKYDEEGELVTTRKSKYDNSDTLLLYHYQSPTIFDDSTFHFYTIDGLYKNDKSYKKGKVNYTTDYTNDTFGRVIKADIYLYGEMKRYRIYNYPNDSTIIENTFSPRDELKQSDHWIYNKKGDLVKQVNYNETGRVLNSYEYYYDSLGNRVRTYIYKGSNEKPVFYENRIWRNGKLLQENSYNYEGQLYESTEYHYNEKKLKNLVIYRDYKDGKSVISSIYTIEYEFY